MPKSDLWRGYKVGLLAVCLLAFALRLHLLEDIFLNEDEEKSQLLYVQQPAVSILTHYEPNNHWLTSGLGHFMGWLGQQRFLLRWPSVLFGVLAVPLMSVAGRWLLDSRTEGLLAAFLLAFSAFHLHWSQQFRGYSAFLFFALFSLLLLYRMVQTNRQAYGWGLVASLALTLASHLYGVLTLAVVVVVLISGRQRYCEQKGAHLSRPGWAWSISLLSVAAISYFGWFGKSQAIDFYHAPPQGTLAQLIYYQYLAFVPTLPEVADFFKGLALAFTAQAHEGLALLLFAGPSIAGLVFVFVQRARLALFLTLWLFVPIIAVILAELAVAGFFVFNRFLIFILPVWLLLVVRSLTGGSRWLARRLAPAGPWRSVTFASLTIIAMGYLSWPNLQAIRTHFLEQASNDWRGVAAHLADHIGPTDLIICNRLWYPTSPDPDDNQLCVLELRRRLAAAPARFSLQAPKIVTPDQIGSFPDWGTLPGTVWLVIWGVEGQLHAPAALTFDRLGYTTLLKADTGLTRAANLNQLIGELTRLEPPLLNPIRRLSADFGQPPTIRLLGYAAPVSLQKGQTTKMTTIWQALGPISQDYTIFLHLRNQADQTVAQLDFRPFDGAYPTFAWAPGSVIAETRSWTLPPNLPPGSYTLCLGLYNVQTLARLPLPSDNSGENALMLGQIHLK